MEEEIRQNPDLLLKAVSMEENKTKAVGHLKIFFGYAAGVGKTYAMLKAAHSAKGRGVDVICGYIEPHARPRTSALLKGLEKLPEKEIEYNGITLKEFDIDAAIARKPELILVDELAHTNAEGSRHVKRYQDIKELLEAGIDVYTTVNVQHIESLNDIVASITGVMVRERIPDSVFDQADQVTLVDIEPKDLIERMNSGYVYQEVQAQRAVSNFFTIENLTALREIALRRCADRVNILTEMSRIKNKGDYHTEEHILVCLSSAPSNPKIIRTAARMASAFKSSFTALFVQTPYFSSMEEEDKKRLRDNMRLAQQLGAKIEIVYGEDIPLQIAEFARLSGVSKIVIGRSTLTRKRFFGKPTLTEMLIQHAPNLDIHVIPDAENLVQKYHKVKKNSKFEVKAWEIALSIGILAMATALGMVFRAVKFSDPNIIAIYILGVFLTAIGTRQQIYSLISAVLSVLLFNFFFTEPLYTLQVRDPGYTATFIVMFLVAMISSSFAVKLKNNAYQSARAAFRTKILFDTNQMLQQAENEKAIMDVTANHLLKLLNRDIVMYLANNDKLETPHTYEVKENAFHADCISENEQAVAAWVLKNNKRAGATTDTLSSAKCLYLAIRTQRRVYGVVGIVIGQLPLDAFENSILLSILGECALALEGDINAKEKEEAAIMAQNEQLRANLLRGISHDLRTPLTSISGNASNLMTNWKYFDEETMNQLFTDIYDESMWLINLVENLLSVTRLEEGQIKLHLATELLEDIIQESLVHLNRNAVKHNISIELEDEFLLVKVDAKLITQVFINIIDNAVKYTQEGSDIIVTANKVADQVEVRIADNGPGINKEDKQKVFERFYSGNHKISDGRRSIGLGLSLCKSIVSAHGGKIQVLDNQPKGTVFMFTLPAGEVHIHE